MPFSYFASVIGIVFGPCCACPVILPPSDFSSIETLPSGMFGIFTVPSYVPVRSGVCANATRLPSRKVTVNRPSNLMCFTFYFLSGKLRRFVLLFLLKRVLGLSDDFSKRLRLVHGEIREHFAIEFDRGELQTVHELRIVQTVQTSSSADAHDPQAAKIALLQLASGVGEV